MSTIDATSEPEPPAPPTDWSTATRLHERWLRTVIRARLGERQAIDEVMQEVHLAAVLQRTPLQEVREIGAWLYRLALRQTLLYRRRQGRRARLVGRYAARLEAGEPGESEPIAFLLAEERAALVRRAIEELPAKDAEILLLKYTEGWSYQDLARRLGLSEGAVESRLHRARTRLRCRLSEMQSSD
ncbi:MAG: RNA polymerase sigma factor [Isosphaeraceae bacterium]|nr:RNA polymerase sigma factor [Isosphaeraceae bacterium]